MERIVIEGLHPLSGAVRISGAKNAALPILCASILNGRANTFRNVPRLWDIATTRKLLTHLGADVDADGNVVHVDSGPVHNLEATYDIVSTMRASVLILGPLLGRFGQARVSLPGGCAIGTRPVDQHIAGLKALGAEIDIHQGYLHARGRRLRGTRFRFDMVTVGGTEQLAMAAVLAHGTTVLENCAVEPEVEDLCHCLVAMGARIDGIGTRTLTIEGVEDLKAVDWSVIPDRIEAGTYLCAPLLAGGSIEVTHVRLDHMAPILDALREAGVEVAARPQGGQNPSGDQAAGRSPLHTLSLTAPTRTHGFQLTTAPHPGFPTDMQAQLMAVATKADGESTIRETIFENRFLHAAELARLGADIHVVDRDTVRVRGVPELNGATVTASDLRASAALVLAGLGARGTTVVRRVYHLFRGYEGLDEKLRALGAKVWREQADSPG